MGKFISNFWCLEQYIILTLDSPNVLLWFHCSLKVNSSEVTHVAKWLSWNKYHLKENENVILKLLIASFFWTLLHHNTSKLFKQENFGLQQLAIIISSSLLCHQDDTCYLDVAAAKSTAIYLQVLYAIRNDIFSL